jgi:ABC-type uncharacterized transport system permease subunit
VLLDSFLAAGLALGTPILLAALGELMVERTGVINIGLEGVMLGGAFAAAAAADASGSACAGVLLELLFGVAAVVLRADQIIVGTALNLLAIGVTGALYRALYGTSGTGMVLPTLPPIEIPLLHDLPVVGRALFAQHALVYLGLILTPLLAGLLSATGIGLRLRSLGDQPMAAASLGLRVRPLRMATLGCAGALAGLAGATLALAAANTFVEGISAGRGFIALAVVVFGGWSPWGALVGAMLFGLASALQFQFQAAALAVPYQAFLMLPYVLTLAVLAFASNRKHAPLALGSSYERD